MHFINEDNKFIIKDGNSELWVEPWGKNSFRVRMTKEAKMDSSDWALTEKMPEIKMEVTMTEIDVTDPWYKSEEYAKYHQTGTEATL